MEYRRVSFERVISVIAISLLLHSSLTIFAVQEVPKSISKKKMCLLTLTDKKNTRAKQMPSLQKLCAFCFATEENERGGKARITNGHRKTGAAEAKQGERNMDNAN